MSKYKLLLITAFLMIILMTLSIKNTNNIILYNYHPTIEISQKFDFKANYVYATFEDVNGILCEKRPPKEISEKLKEYQIEVIE